MAAEPLRSLDGSEKRFYPPHLQLAPPLRLTPSEIHPGLWHQKIIDSLGYCASLRDDMFSHFDRTPTCERQTHGRTHDHRIHRASVARQGRTGENHQADIAVIVERNRRVECGIGPTRGNTPAECLRLTEEVVSYRP